MTNEKNDLTKGLEALLGVTLNETFKVTGRRENIHGFIDDVVLGYFKLTKYGLVGKDGNLHPAILSELVLGRCQVVKILFKPNCGESYHYVEMDGSIHQKTWEGVIADYHNYKTDNCFMSTDDITSEVICGIIAKAEKEYLAGIR